MLFNIKSVLKYQISELNDIQINEHHFKYISIGRYKNEQAEFIDGARFEYENTIKNEKYSIFYVLNSDKFLVLNHNIEFDFLKIPENNLRKSISEMILEIIKENESHVVYFKEQEKIKNRLIGLSDKDETKIYEYLDHMMLMKIKVINSEHIFVLLNILKKDKEESLISIGLEFEDNIKIYEKYENNYEKVSSLRKNQIIKYLKLDNLLNDILDDEKANKQRIQI